MPRVGPRVKLIDDQAMLRQVGLMSCIHLSYLYFVLFHVVVTLVSENSNFVECLILLI